MNLNTSLTLRQLSTLLSMGSLPLDDEAVFWSGASRGIRARATLSRENNRFQFVVYEDRWEGPCIELTLRERGGIIEASPEEVDFLHRFIEVVSGLEVIE